MTLTREALERSSTRRFARVTIDDGKIHADDASDLGPNVRIQTITDQELDAYERIPFDKSGKFSDSRLHLRRRKLLQLCLIDDSGSRLYGDEEIGKIAMDGGLAATLFIACVKFTGIDAANEGRVTVEEAKKN